MARDIGGRLQQSRSESAGTCTQSQPFAWTLPSFELVGTNEESWEKAAKAAVERAAKSLRDLRVAEVVEQDLVIESGKVVAYRTKVKVSFKYEGKD
jgi:dodecin